MDYILGVESRIIVLFAAIATTLFGTPPPRDVSAEQGRELLVTLVLTQTDANTGDMRTTITGIESALFVMRVPKTFGILGVSVPDEDIDISYTTIDHGNDNIVSISVNNLIDKTHPHVGTLRLVAKTPSDDQTIKIDHCRVYAGGLSQSILPERMIYPDSVKILTALGNAGIIIEEGGEQPEDPVDPEKININTASRSELMSLPGIGGSIADGIISYRENKLFESIDEIKNVPRIGDATFSNIKDLITI